MTKEEGKELELNNWEEYSSTRMQDNLEKCVWLSEFLIDKVLEYMVVKRRINPQYAPDKEIKRVESLLADSERLYDLAMLEKINFMNDQRFNLWRKAQRLKERFGRVCEIEKLLQEREETFRSLELGCESDVETLAS